VTEPREELALEVQRLWREHEGLPLRWVSGTRALAASTSFYAPDNPRYWSLWSIAVETPWVNTDDVQAAGGVIVCAVGDGECERLAEAWSANRHVVHVAKSVRGFHFRPQAYVLYLLTPRWNASPP
jgi:hypothetical protein